MRPGQEEAASSKSKVCLSCAGRPGCVVDFTPRMRKTSKTRAQIRPGGRSMRCLKEDWTAKEKSNREMKTENRSDVFDGEEIETHWCGRDRVLETKLLWNLNSKYRQQDKWIWEGEEERPALNPNWDLVTISSNREKKTDRCQQNQQGKINRTHKTKSDFSIALRQHSYTTEVTALPPTFLIENEKHVLGSLLN
jgi:hypothetical protein